MSKVGHRHTDTSNLVTVAQAARELGISRRAVVHRIRAGTLTAVKIGDANTSPYVITRDELDRAKMDGAA